MSSTPYVKICGLRTPESVDCAVHNRADAIGFVFAESVRQVSPELARELASRAPSNVETVGVFRKQGIDDVIDLARRAGVTTIQFHGYEPYADIERAQNEGFRTLRAFSIDEFITLSDDERRRWSSKRLLIDAVEPGGGVPFDPQALELGAPSGWWLLAGGLTPQNVGELVAQLKPAGVDVSSGVESRRGVKSLDLIEAFLTAAKRG